MNIDREFAMIELTDQEANDYAAGQGSYAAIRHAAVDLADETDRTVEIRRGSDGSLVDTIGID